MKKYLNRKIQDDFKPAKSKDGDAPKLSDACNMCGKKFIWLIRTRVRMFFLNTIIIIVNKMKFCGCLAEI